MDQRMVDLFEDHTCLARFLVGVVWGRIERVGWIGEFVHADGQWQATRLPTRSQVDSSSCTFWWIFQWSNERLGTILSVSPLYDLPVFILVLLSADRPKSNRRDKRRRNIQVVRDTGNTFEAEKE